VSGLPRHAHCDHPVQTYREAKLPCAACSQAPYLRWSDPPMPPRHFTAPITPDRTFVDFEFHRLRVGETWVWSREGLLSHLPLEVAAQFRARTAESELAVTRAVLEDLTYERGVPWVSLVLRRRDDVMSWLQSWYAERCPHCRVDAAEAHGRNCHLAELLRALGGPEETQRQVDAAWEDADGITGR